MGAWLVRQIEEAAEERAEKRASAAAKAAPAEIRALPAPEPQEAAPRREAPREPRRDGGVEDPRLLSALQKVAGMLEQGALRDAPAFGDDAVVALSARIDGLAEVVGALSRTVTDNLKTVERCAERAEASQNAAENAVSAAEAARVEAAAALRASAALAEKTVALYGGVDAPGEDWKDEISQELAMDLDTRLEALEERLALRESKMERRFASLHETMWGAAAETPEEAPEGWTAKDAGPERGETASHESASYESDPYEASHEADPYDHAPAGPGFAEEAAESAAAEPAPIAPIFVDLPSDGDLLEIGANRDTLTLDIPAMDARRLRDRVRSTLERDTHAHPAAAAPSEAAAIAATSSEQPGALSDSIARLVDAALAEDDDEAIALPFWRRRAAEKRAERLARHRDAVREEAFQDAAFDDPAPDEEEEEEDPAVAAPEREKEPLVRDAPAERERPGAEPSSTPLSAMASPSMAFPPSMITGPAAPLPSMTLDEAAMLDHEAFETEAFEDDDDHAAEAAAPDGPEETDAERASLPTDPLSQAIERARQARAAFEGAPEPALDPRERAETTDGRESGERNLDERNPARPGPDQWRAASREPRRQPPLPARAEASRERAGAFDPRRSGARWSDQPSWREPSFSRAHVSRAADAPRPSFPLDWPPAPGERSEDGRADAVRDESGSVGYGVAISLALMALTAGGVMALSF